jgi:hypothetical protein
MAEELPDQLSFSVQALPVSFILKRLLSKVQRDLKAPVLAWMQNLVRIELSKMRRIMILSFRQSFARAFPRPCSVFF